MTEYSKLTVDETEYETEVPAGIPRRFKGLPDPLEIRAFVPGIISDISVKVGQAVKEKQLVLHLEAMKMFNEVSSSVSGRVAQILVKPGERVEKGQLLVRLSPK